jgi:hypothetical protein
MLKMNGKGHLVIAGIAIILLAAICNPALKHHSFYVSPEGDDGNSGTKRNPFRTIVKAKEEVRKLLAADSMHEIKFI